ncbi:S-type pyocin domain-containing protein [Marinobacter mobilis]|uniref:S-type pyocin domain-containing protein n=1 Tax=Marinobacter mobilis TaxID=488533 RepID=UPI0035C75EA9
MDVTKISDPHSLALHEALMIEGGWDQYSNQELASYLSSSRSNPTRLRDQLASGELVLLKEPPTVPVFRLVSGSLIPTESSSIAIAENAVRAMEKRFGGSVFPIMAAGYSLSDNLPLPPNLAYTPEPPLPVGPTEPLPLPVVISENFALPPIGPKVFAKSCTRPYGDTFSNEEPEKASNFGSLAVFAPATITRPGANGLRPLSLVAGSVSRLANGWAMAARLGASALGTATSTMFLALWPSRLGDGTLYTEDELLGMAEAAIRVRFHLHVDSTGNLRVAGYHVNESSGYGDRIQILEAQPVGEHFEAVIDDGFTLVWYPDESGHRPVVTTEYPADSGIDPYNILVTPIQEDGQEHSPPGYQRPFEDQVELIVSFPVDSGIEPLYLVFQKRAGDGQDAISETSAATPAHNAANFAKHEELLSVTESANPLVESLRSSGQLPPNYVTKAQAVQQGWRPGKALGNSIPDGQIGGDVFQNTTNILPSAPGRAWYEADIGLDSTMSRVKQSGTRLLYSSDGLLYVTPDHYETVHMIGRWKN